MDAYNRNKSLRDRRQLSLYRVLGPIPNDNLNLHACVHLYASDRNSLFVISNYFNINEDLAGMSSLSHTVIFHTNPDKFTWQTPLESTDRDTAENEGETEQWFCQEAWTEVSGGNRGMHMSKI